MENVVAGYEAQDVREQVEKILRGLGSPEPPLKLEEVRELLRLDRQFYSSQDQSTVREVVSRLTVAGKQLVMRPTILDPENRSRQFSMPPEHRE